jgi:tetratricopeptide (TPR) repeat protein
MKLILKIVLLLIAIEVSSQSNTIDNNYNYFKAGITAFDDGNYFAADTLFQKALEQNAESEVIYNLGVTKLMLEEYCEGCKFLRVGKIRYGDQHSTELYDKICIRKIDTSYYDRRYNQISDQKKYKYLIEEIYYECDSIVNGIIHKKNHRSTLILPGDIFNSKTVDIFATYRLIDSIKYYEFINASLFDTENNMVIENFKSKIENYLSTKYNLENIPHNEAYCSIEIYIDKNGKVVDYYLQSFPHEVLDKETASMMEKDINNAVLNINGLEPDMYLGKPVSSIHTIMFGLERQ